MISNKKDLAKLKKSLREVELHLAASQKGDFATIFLSSCHPFTLNGDECWEWNGILKHGCSTIQVRTGQAHTRFSARRLSYLLFREPIALSPMSYEDVCFNICKNKKCIRPSHLTRHRGKITMEAAFLKRCPIFNIENQRCWEVMVSPNYKFNVQGDRSHIKPRRISYHLFREPLTVRSVKARDHVSNVCLNHDCIRPSHLYRGTKNYSLIKMKNMKIAIGERLWWLWNVEERVQIRRKVEGKIFYRHKIIQPHKEVVLLAVRTLAVLLQCQEPSIWRWIRPSRKASLRLEPPKRALRPRGTNHAPKIYLKRKLKPDFIEWEFKPHGKEKGKQKI